MKQKSIYLDIRRAEGSTADLILIAGGSCSGKSYFSKKLQESLENKGEKVLLLSADNFYKGASRTISPSEEVAKIVYEVTGKLVNDEKFTKENCKILKERGIDATAIKKAFKNINWDKPDVIDLEGCAKFINTMMLKKEKSVKLPVYIKKVSDITCEGAQEFTGKNYTKIIMEGLYTLNDELLKRIKYKNPTKCYIECDIYTILFRRLKRDCYKGVSSYNASETLKMFLTRVADGYNKYILPTKEKAGVLYTSIPEEHEKGHFLVVAKKGVVTELQFIFDDKRETMVFSMAELDKELKDPKAFLRMFKKVGYDIMLQE